MRSILDGQHLRWAASSEASDLSFSFFFFIRRAAVLVVVCQLGLCCGAHLKSVWETVVVGQSSRRLLVVFVVCVCACGDWWARASGNFPSKARVSIPPYFYVAAWIQALCRVNTMIQE